MGHVLAGLGRTSQKDDEKPRSHGIQRAGVANLFSTKELAHLPDNVVRGDPGRLIHKENAVGLAGRGRGA